MEICIPLQQPGLETRSPFATATCKLPCFVQTMPARAAASRSTKLWVELESRSAVRRTPWMLMKSCIILVKPGLDTHEGVDGDGGVLLLLNFIVVQHLNAKELLTYLLVPLREEFIAVETLFVLAALRDFRRR
jgi:hypothetical protein